MTTTTHTFETTERTFWWSAMRSPSALLSGIAVLSALPLAVLTAVALGGGDQISVHFALGAGMILLFLSTFDFRVPRVLGWIGRAGVMALGSIFLLQGVAEALQSHQLLELAYGNPLIQSIEKLSAYPILLWFAGLLFADSRGLSRLFGSLALGAIVLSELYSLWLTLNGGTPDILLRAFYLLPFVWLAIEGVKGRSVPADAGRVPSAR